MSQVVCRANQGLDVNILTCDDQLTQNIQVGQNLFFVPNAVVDFSSAIVTGLFPPTSSTQGIYVDKSGSDINGDGSILNPYLTISYALSQITDNSVTKIYNILIGSGDYVENVTLKPNVNLTAQSPLSVTITGNIGISSSFGDGQFNTCALSYIIIGTGSNVNIDFYGATATQGLIVFFGVTMYENLLVNGNGTNTIFVAQNSSFIGASNNLVSGFMQFYNSLLIGSTTFQSASTRPSQIFMFKNNSINSLTFLTTTPDSLSAYLYSTTSANLILNGPDVFVLSTSDSIPTVSNTSILNSAVLNRLNDATALGYSPSVPANWSPVPTTVQEGLDILATQSVDYGDLTPSTSNLVGITSIDSLIFRYQVIGNIVMINYILNLTLPAVPQAPCLFDCSLPIALNNPALTEFEITGNMDISCNDGFNNPSNADKQYSMIQSIIGDNANCRFRFGIGASATSSSLMCTGTISYRL